MFTKTILLTTLATFFWGFFGGWLLWGFIGDPILADHLVTTGLMKEVPDMGILAIGCLIVAFSFSNIYSKWARGYHSVSSGAQFGIWLGLLFGLGNGLIDHSTANLIDLSGSIINGIIYIVHFAIMGIVASLIFRKYSTKT